MRYFIVSSFIRMSRIMSNLLSLCANEALIQRDSVFMQIPSISLCRPSLSRLGILSVIL